MKKLIVNADDFGLTEGINRAILDGHNNGIITSTTLMANGMAFDSAVAARSTAPALGIGVHLNLTQGRPVSLPSRVPSIVTSESSFYPSPGVLIRQILRRRVRLADIETELRSQIDKVASAGIRITHLDSHKHVHLGPPVFSIVVKLAREYGIGCIRCPIEPAWSALGPLLRRRRGWMRMTRQYVLGRALSTLAAFQTKKIRGAGLHRTERFYGLSQTGFLNTNTLGTLLRGLPRGTSELMCHPGYLDEALLKTRTRLRAERETELAALTSQHIRGLVAEMGIELISYDKLLPAVDPATRKCNERLRESIPRG
ncbi:MAG TPA: ChbG/HpnK family deacetylase [Terriglobia bacterium]|nr:ChbG/HpnK family deacetylase [Terriglobia bacterium]